MARLQGQYLRAASPPFQYIITTTTSPPPELQDEGVLRLRLCAKDTDELLFCKNLGIASEGESSGQLPLI
ncbi:MAG: hypothetical protein JRJ75_16335 [Deltaproteobacteria bacterium]|nr:hypothetical protein [Deltaproteobacteria bacterium]